MPISGRNSGAAVVYGANRGVDTFARILAQQQQERENEQKQLAESLASLNTDGLREEDKDSYYKGFDEWRTKKQQAYATRDKQTKFNLNAEAAKLEQGLREKVYRSKEGAKQDQMMAMEYFKDPDKFADGFLDMYQKSRKAPIDSPDRINDWTAVPLERDLSKVPDLFAKMNKELLDNARESSPVNVPFKGGNRTGTILRYDKIVDPKKQAESYLTAFDLNKDIRYAAKKLNPDLPWAEDPIAAKAAWVERAVKQYPLQYSRSTSPVLDLIPRAAGSGSGSGAVSPSDFKVTTKVFQTRGADGNLKDTPADFTKYVTVNPTSFRIPQIEGYSISEGKNTMLIPEEGTVNLTGLGWAKVKGGNTRFRASLVNNQGDEWIVEEEDLPLDVRNDKYYKAAKAAVGQPPAKQQAKAEPKTNEMVTVVLDGKTGQIPKSNLEAFKKKYPKAQVR